MTTQIEVLRRLMRPVVDSLHYKLWGIEYLPKGKHSIIRIYIDSVDGIYLDDCEKVSRQISAVLDVEDPIKENYTLEVSSPGLDRPLFTVEQFAAYTGHLVSIRLMIPYNGRKKFKGVIKSTEKDDVILDCDDQHYAFPIQKIAKANLVPQF